MKSYRQRQVQLPEKDRSKAVRLAVDGIKSFLQIEPLTLAQFIPFGWDVIEPSTPLKKNWHIDCIGEHLQAVVEGQIQFLVINLPPRSGKSNLVSCIWPAWAWTQRPGLKWIFISYAQALAEQFSKNRRDLIESDWYRNRYASVQIALDQNQKREFSNTSRGIMTATSVGGTLTGKGADIIVIDDGIDPERAQSKAEREAAIRFVKSTISTRLNDKRRGAIVEISQRTHQQDISGTLLSEGIYTHLNLPAIATHKTIIEFPISKRTVVRETGDILHEDREDAAILARQKIQMTMAGKSAKTYEAQYQQNPTSDEGGMFRRNYWKFYKFPPLCQYWIWAWDTAMEEGEENDFTVGALLGFHASGTIVHRIVRARMQYPELVATVKRESAIYLANEIVIENKVSGISLAQSLRRETSLPVIAYPRKGDDGKNDVRGDKVFRAANISGYVESGRVALPEGEMFVPEFIEELASFPEGEHDDQVDAFSLGMNKFYKSSLRPAAALVGSGVSMPMSVNDNGTPKNGNGLLRRKPSWA